MILAFPRQNRRDDRNHHALRVFNNQFSIFNSQFSISAEFFVLFVCFCSKPIRAHPRNSRPKSFPPFCVNSCHPCLTSSLTILLKVAHPALMASSSSALLRSFYKFRI